ncbi:exported hypothetical protein [Plantibacter sp. T3]|nr:exported hypothetical protein [Plantibacter sp. T3]
MIRSAAPSPASARTCASPMAPVPMTAIRSAITASPLLSSSQVLAQAAEGRVVDVPAQHPDAQGGGSDEAVGDWDESGPGGSR